MRGILEEFSDGYALINLELPVPDVYFIWKKF